MSKQVGDLKDLIQMVDQEEVLKVVQDLVRIPSINPPGYEKEACEYIVNYFESLNIPVDTQEISPGRLNVVTRLKGKGIAKPLMFTGHIDVVPVSDAEAKRWQSDPFSGEIKDGMLHGRGSIDMKGGLGAAMVAMGTLARNGIQPPGDIVLAATVDEEDLMRGAKALIKSPLIAGVDRVVVCEPTDMRIEASSRGRTWAEVTVRGQTAHASVKGAGVNAIDRALILMNRMKNCQIPHQKHPLLGESFWQTTLIKGGIEPAVIPDWCTITVDARLVPGQTSGDIWGLMESLFLDIQKEIPDFKADINILEERDPWETPLDDKVVGVLETSCNTVGLPVKHTGFVATTDGTIFRRIGILGVIFGPGQLGGCHKENEAISVDQLVKATQVYIAMMKMWNGN